MGSMKATMHDRIKKFYDLIHDFPRDRPFDPKKRGLNGFDIKRLRNADILRQVTREGSYALTDKARDELEAYEPTVESPCDHRGIKNLGDDRYTCGVDDCDVRFGRETAAEVLGVQG